MKEKNILECTDLSVILKGKSILNKINFHVQENETVGLIGPSGSGKSVLLKTLAGVLPSAEGNINYYDLAKEDISLMFQEGALFDSMSVFDNLAFPLLHGNLPLSSYPEETRQEISKKIISILDHVGLANAHHKNPAQLSGGMKRRASLSRCLIMDPKLALLDDPTCGLDPIASNVIMKLIFDLQKKLQSSMVIVSQDLRRLLPYVDRLVAIFDGEIVYSGKFTREEIAAKKELEYFINCRYDLN